VSQIVFDGVKACRSCGYTGMTDGRKESAARRAKYDGSEDVRVVVRAMQGAKKRCENPATTAYKNYGGRGIKFDFSSVEGAVTYVMQELGPRPSAKHTLDRIDNNGNYARGNLRWATRTTQRLNQRVTDRHGPDFARIQRLKALKPEYSYESIRQFVKRGLSDEEIIARKKGKHYGIFAR
jgi:hypothetical protein